MTLFLLDIAILTKLNQNNKKSHFKDFNASFKDNTSSLNTSFLPVASSGINVGKGTYQFTPTISSTQEDQMAKADGKLEIDILCI